jgi:osmotically-inducible protein OsmY
MKTTTLASMVALAALISTGCAMPGSESGMSQDMGMSQSGSAESVDDTIITSRVKSRLSEDPQLGAMQIQVKTLNGTVQLSGFAATQAEKDRAAELASDVPDVRGVRNNVSVQVDRD